MSVISVWIVTKDIRLEDNNTLKTALSNSTTVLPIFVFDDQQFANGNPNSKNFLIESLNELHNKLKSLNSCLHVVLKSNLQNFISTNHVSQGFILRGYTPFEKQRYLEYSQILRLNEIDDVLGLPYQNFLKSDGTYYKVFSYFEKNIDSKGPFPYADMNLPSNITNLGKIDEYVNFDYMSLMFYSKPKLPESTWIGGSTEGIQICMTRYTNMMNANNPNYMRQEEKDISAHIKFGTISPRLAYYCGAKNGILWRALYYILMENQVVVIKPRNVRWIEPSDPLFDRFLTAWRTGNTGYDLVDAGIHQLLRTGFMDNKIRMLVANFLVFVLNINWQYGEQLFRENLVDYDWPLNLGNWAWAAQIGVDNPSPNRAYQSKPIRIFNPDTYLTDNKERKAYRNAYISRWLQRGQIQRIADFKTSISYTLQFY